MKIPNHSIPLIFAISMLLLSCDKEEKPPISQGNMWDCHQKITWDSMRTKDALIGEWEWEYIGCFWNPKDANDYEFDGMTIEFKEDNTLEVKQNGQITQTSSWKFVDIDADLFAIKVDPIVKQLYGRILFCEDRVEFNHSFIDGCDNYFKRKE